MTDKHTRKDALKELLARVDAGGKIQPFLFQDAFNNQNHVNCAGEAYDAFDGSLNAALAMHNAVLPGWSTEIIYRPFSTKPHLWHVRLSTDHTGYGNGMYEGATKEDLPRAWLCAILKALIAKCDT
jgi:hypothetical protein